MPHITTSGWIAIAAALFAGLSALFALYSARQAKVANRVEVLANFLKEYRDLQPERRYVLRVMGNLHGFAYCGISELPCRMQRRATKVCYYLDSLGLLVEKRLVKEADIIQIVGGSIQRQYFALRPFIEAERRIRDEDVHGGL